VTQVDFFHGVTDRLSAAGQITAQLYRDGHRVLIYAPDATVASAIDRLLWTQPPTGFLPHCPGCSPVAGQTPIIVGRTLDDADHDDVLINLNGDLPAGFARFHRLIEIVGDDDAEKLPARNRYRHYRDRGYPLTAQDFRDHRAPS
jgi:DNA polymerase III subunit chi